MKLKKLNAVLGLLIMLLLLDHSVCLSVWMLTRGAVFGPIMMMLHILLAVTLVHAFLSMCLCLFGHEENTVAYPRLNRRTVIQRFSAVALIVLMFTHMMVFDCFYRGQTLNGLQKAIHAGACILYFAAVLTHVGTSLSKALITLGVGSPKLLRVVDWIVWSFCAVVMIAGSVGAVILFSGGLIS